MLDFIKLGARISCPSLGSPRPEIAPKMWPFLQNTIADFWHACIEIYQSPIALPVLLTFLWRARTLSKTDLLQMVLPAILVSYVVAFFFPLNARFFAFQEKWYELFCEGISAEPDLAKLVRGWHLEQHFLSSKAATMALVFYLQMLIGESSKDMRSKALKILGATAFLVVCTALMLTLIYMAGNHTMIPSKQELSSLSDEAGVAAYRRGVEWYTGLPIWAGATAMLDLLASVVVYQWLKAKKLEIPKSAIILYVVCPSVILTFALISIATLSVTKGVLWLVFVLVAYAPLLAATRAGIREDRSLLAFYRRGVKSILGGGQT